MQRILSVDEIHARRNAIGMVAGTDTPAVRFPMPATQCGNQSTCQLGRTELAAWPRRYGAIKDVE